MITRQTKLQLLVFLLISVVGLSLHRRPLRRPRPLLPRPGLRRVGRLRRLRRHLQGRRGHLPRRPGRQGRGRSTSSRAASRVDLRLRPGTKVPSDVPRRSSATAPRSASSSSTCSRSATARPTSRTATTIPRDRTEIPISPTQLVVNLDDFVNSVDTEDLAVVLDELGTAFGNGAGDSLQRLVDDGDVAHPRRHRRAARDQGADPRRQHRPATPSATWPASSTASTATSRTSPRRCARATRTSGALYANGTQSANELDGPAPQERAPTCRSCSATW